MPSPITAARNQAETKVLDTLVAQTETALDLLRKLYVAGLVQHYPFEAMSYYQQTHQRFAAITELRDTGAPRLRLIEDLLKLLANLAGRVIDDKDHPAPELAFELTGYLQTFFEVTRPQLLSGLRASGTKDRILDVDWSWDAIVNRTYTGTVPLDA